jgi:hypothetical protein
MKVFELIQMLQTMPETSQVWVAGQEGLYPCEKGNLFPLKVHRDEHRAVLYIDDGFCGAMPLIDEWMPLDEYAGINGKH